MIKVSILYPNTEGCKFDMEYYCNSHMPMIQEKLGGAVKEIAAEQGLAGGAPDSPPTYIAMGHLICDSAEAFQAAFGSHAEAIVGDIPNYTDIQPLIQISEIKI